MATDKKISELTALTGANVAGATDLIPIVDTSATTTKYITVQELVGTSKRYLANTSQASTSAPTVTEMVNTLGVTVTWAYTSVGKYTGTLSASYGSGHGVIRGMGVAVSSATFNGFWILYNSGTSTLIIETFNLAGTNANDILATTPVCFELY